MNSQHRSQRGINLIELLVTISIATISLTVGVPSFQNLRTSSDRSSAIIELVSAARLARSEAALRGTSFSICASSDGTSCSDSSDWSTGWLVFRDPDENGQVASQEDVIRVVRFEHSRFTLTADDNIDSAITFGTFGYAQPTHGELLYADSQVTRALQLTFIGRLHVDEPADS